MRYRNILVTSLILGIYALKPIAGISQDSHMPRAVPAMQYLVPGRPVEPKNVPDYANDSSQGSDGQLNNAAGGSTVLRGGLESMTLPLQTRLKLVVEYPIDARTSQPGDIFEAHVRDDIFLGRLLVLPRGTLVRGRVSEITKARLISRAARIGLKLDQIVTPTGEVIALDAGLEFQKGITNKNGQLDPGTSFGTRVGSSVRAVTGLSDKGVARGALLAANIATLGAPAVATALGSSAIALFRSGDNISLQPGQELEVLLTNDLGLQLN